jgi:hypothetical protein
MFSGSTENHALNGRKLSSGKIKSNTNGFLEGIIDMQIQE